MKKFILFLVLMSSVSFAAIPEPCEDDVQIIKSHKMDLDTKTLKSWIRLLNNKSKQGKYGIVLSKAEIRALIACLTEELELRKKIGKMK
jgi:hypothetical protein